MSNVAALEAEVKEYKLQVRDADAPPGTLRWSRRN